MELHELKPSSGSRQKRKRVGRGPGSGLGKTCGKGHKGQNARAGGGVRLGFEGGQHPIYMRLPKHGFTNRNRKEYATINFEVLNKFPAGTEITPELLQSIGKIKDLKAGLKVLADGELDRALSIKAHKFSSAALAKIEASGGTAEVL